MEKDLDYAFHLERAISEKYGPDAVINPASRWNKFKEKKYLKDLALFYSRQDESTIRIEHNGFLVSEKLFNKEIDANCDICGTYRPEIVSRVYFLKYDCCFGCYVKYVEDRENRWLSGWRPTNQQGDKICQ